MSSTPGNVEVGDTVPDNTKGPSNLVTYRWGLGFGDNAYRALFLPPRIVRWRTHDRAGIVRAATELVNDALPDWIQVAADGQVTYQPSPGNRTLSSVNQLVDTAIVQVGLNQERMTGLWAEHTRPLFAWRAREVAW